MMSTSDVMVQKVKAHFHFNSPLMQSYLKTGFQLYKKKKRKEKKKEKKSKISRSPNLQMQLNFCMVSGTQRGINLLTDAAKSISVQDDGTDVE